MWIVVAFIAGVLMLSDPMDKASCDRTVTAMTSLRIQARCSDAPQAQVKTNRQPVVADDAPYWVIKDNFMQIEAPGVLANDTDADGDKLTAALMTPPKHGKVTLYANGGFTYRPDPGYVGPDEFFYQPYDGTTYSANAGRVAITVLSNDEVRLTR